MTQLSALEASLFLTVARGCLSPRRVNDMCRFVRTTSGASVRDRYRTCLQCLLLVHRRRHRGSVGSCTDFMGCQNKMIFFIEEGSNKLCFLLCHTKQYKKHVKKAQGSHWKAKATRNDLKLHYPVSNSFSFFLRKCNCERLGEGIGAVASMSALKRAIKSLLWVSL